MGIIDILQEYNARKRSEHLLRTAISPGDRFTMSSVRPVVYAKRFVEFIKQACPKESSR